LHTYQSHEQTKEITEFITYHQSKELLCQTRWNFQWNLKLG